MPAKDTTTSSAPASKTIVVVASENPDFKTWSPQSRRLVGHDALGPGSLHGVRPTDAAFAAIPADQLNAILADTAQLTKILTYHVVPGEIMAANLQPEHMVKTVEGQDLVSKVTNGTATVNGCNIVKTDIKASNGVIHVVDCVLIPPGSMTVRYRREAPIPPVPRLLSGAACAS
jgi:uncharacterized surface protein with fasciclin (FAS1) repeats